MYDMIRQFAAQLSRSEKIALQEDLKAMIAEELAAAPGEPGRCPHCGCALIVRKGSGRDGSRRWLCKGCARTFSAETRGLLASSKLPAAAWMEFAACMADALSLRESARRCGVRLRTSWFMRMRVCEVMRSRPAPFRAGSRCQVDGTYLDESLAGDHRRSGFEMPREPHKNGRGVRLPGISGEKACVVAGANELGDVFCGLACRGRETVGEVESFMRGKVGPGSIVVTDRHTSYVKGLSALEVAAHERHDPADGFGPLNLVNALHSRLKAFLAPFHGVATRRLQSYLDWFCYREQFRSPDADGREALFLDASEGRYETTRRGLVETPHPFMGYWEERMSTVV